MKYSDFVDYSKLDPFKKEVLRFLRPSFRNLSPFHIKIIEQSLGEPAILLDFLNYDFMLAFKSDGVGTKSKIAEQIDDYSGLGIDLIAMNANDLICVGATPIALADEIAVGDSFWFKNQKAVGELLAGLKKGCDQAGIAIPCGETPTLKDVIYPGAINITGSMIGLVKPKDKAVWGQKIKTGDIIYGLASSGIHSNGLTLARKIVDKLPKNYFTSFGQKTIGKELLKPTKIYVKPILEIINKTEIHYLSNITGSAFRKIMRTKKPFTYLIENLPPKPKIFEFLQRKGKVDDYEAYQTWNMGIGLTILAPDTEEKKLAKICQAYKIKLYKLGYIKRGPKRIVIKPLKLIYEF